MGGYAPQAREDSVRPRRLAGASGRPLNFTVRRTLWSALQFQPAPSLPESLQHYWPYM